MGSKKNFLFICAIVVAVIIFSGGIKHAGSGMSGMGRPESAKKEKLIVLVNGSPLMEPLAKKLAKAYGARNSTAAIDIQAGGSGVGIKSAMDSVVDIGLSSRELKPEEKSLKEFKIAIDGIAVIVNARNKINDLSGEQIMKIYTGQITNWKDVGGNDAAIAVISREEGPEISGTFVELAGGKAIKYDRREPEGAAPAVIRDSTEAVLNAVAGDPNAIGYASYCSAKGAPAVKIIEIDGKPCTEENIYSGAYKLSRPFIMLTKTEPTGTAKEFIDFILSPDGQALIASEHYLKAKK